MEIKHIKGVDKGEIMLYALSTCVWCKKTKRLLNQLGVAYSYIDVDLLGEDERQEVEEEIKRWNPICSFPTVVIDKNRCVIGYREAEIRGIMEK
jgi:glutaredoxin-like protein NrdH